MTIADRKEHLMDDTRFDALARSLSGHPNRRAALRLLAAGVLGGVLARGGVVSARALQRPDRDGDGLYDDDEVEVYGTNPDVFDTDGDGVGDGEEVYLGTDPLTIPGGGCAPGECVESVGAPPPYVDPTDTCAIQGLTTCDQVCVDLVNSPYHCGACGNVCPVESACQGGFCTVQPACAAGQARCGDGYCTDLRADVSNCGFCGNRCPFPYVCCSGTCVDISSDSNNCGECGTRCFIPLIGDPVCANYTCA
jgi:hypothetical protein